MANIVIYTSLVGKYDQLKQPKCVFDGFDYICFSNDFSERKIGVWEIRPIPFECKDKTRLSRFVKLNPHLALPDYEYSLWMDSNLCILTDELFHIMNSLIEKNVVMASVLHPKLDCIYDDAVLCISGGRDSYFVIKKQVDYLHSQNYPYHNGLYENNLIFRKNDAEIVRRISEDWWRLYMCYSKRDQLSLCYVLWKNDFLPELLLPKGFSTRNSTCINYVGHNKRNIFSWLKLFLKTRFNRLCLHLFPIK